MSQATKKQSGSTPGPEKGWQDCLRAMIEKCTDIPPQVRKAELARVDERVLDDSLFRFLTQHVPPGSDDTARSAAIQRRAEALSPYLGRTLVCVLITLPGVRYTIEVDPDEERVVHWEWQPG